MSEEKFKRNISHVNIGILRSMDLGSKDLSIKRNSETFQVKPTRTPQKSIDLFSRRVFLFGASTLALTACVEPIAFFGERASENFAIQSIKVDTSKLSKGVEGRKNSISNTQVKRDVHKAMSFVFENRKSGARKINLLVQPSKLHLSTRFDSAVSIIPSHMIADVKIIDAKTGKVMVNNIAYESASDYDLSRPVNIFSSLTKLTITKDYLDTIYSFAEQLNVDLFGSAGAKKPKLSELTLAT